MMKWEARVERADNGFILVMHEEDCEGTIREVTEVFEASSGDYAYDMLEPFVCMLWSLAEYFNMQGSKHDKERILITKRQGVDYGSD